MSETTENFEDGWFQEQVMELLPDLLTGARSLDGTPSAACRSKPELWAECIVGATKEDEYLGYFREAGFRDLEVLSRLDYFARSPSDDTREVAHSFGAESIVFRGRRA